MTWFQIWTICWQVAVFLTPMLVACAVFWLRSQFVTKADATTERNRVDGLFANMAVAARAETDRINAQFNLSGSDSSRRYEDIKDRVSDHEARIRLAEADIAKPPTKHTISNELSKLVAVVAGVEKGTSGLGRQVDTIHNYLHTLVERGLDK